jgi:hypothetical protein
MNSLRPVTQPKQLVWQLAAAAGPAIAWVGIGQVPPPPLLTPP